MADELVDAVTATPEGPVHIGLGQTVDVTAEYTLNGPSTAAPGTSVYTILWSEASTGVWASETTPATLPATPFTKTCPASVFPSVGAYTLRVNVLHSGSGLPVYSTAAPDITVHVVAWREGEAPDTTHTEGQATATTVTEGQATATTVTEGQATATTVTEGQATATTVTEGT